MTDYSAGTEQEMSQTLQLILHSEIAVLLFTFLYFEIHFGEQKG